jgi:hypothetical protein
MAKKNTKKTTIKPARRMVVDHDLLEKLCRQFVKPKTVIKHYKKEKKGKRNQPTVARLQELITTIKGSIPHPTLRASKKKKQTKPMRSDAPEKYQVFLEHQGKSLLQDPPYVAPQDRDPYAYKPHVKPDWAKTAQGVLNPPLKEVKDLQTRCEKQCTNAINEIIALKKALVKAKAKQEKYEKRLKMIEEFNKSESTITITEWLLE